MEIVRATAHLPVASLEVVEATFAERVTPTAVFCAWHQLASSDALDVGTRVELEVGTAHGVVAFVCRGVVAWAWAEDAVPAGREGGVGILVGEVLEGGERFSRMVARPGAGARVAPPGARVLSRARLPLPVVVVSAPGPGEAPRPLPSPPPTTMRPVERTPERAGERPGDRAAERTVVAVLDDVLTPISTAEPPSSPPPGETFAALLASALESDSDESRDTGAVAAGPRVERVEDSAEDVAAADAAAPVVEPAAAHAANDDDEDDDDPFARVDDIDVGTDSHELDPMRAPTVAYDVEQLGLPHTAEAGADRLQVLAAALQRHGLDETAVGIDGPTLDGDSDEGPAARPRPAPLPDDLDLSALDDLPPPPELPAPSGGLILDLSDVSAFPEAPPAPVGRPFEAQSTDVDLLASISGADVIAVTTHAPDESADASAETTLRRRPRRSTEEAADDGAPADDDDSDEVDGGEDLPSLDAELLEDAWPEVPGLPADWRSVETELFHNRRLPTPDAWPEWSDLLDARTMGVSFSVSKRGVAGLEFFAWPLQGSKRYSGVGQGESADPRRSRTAILPMADLDDADPFVAEDDGDVFSAPSLPPAPAEEDDDPFASRTTDPRLNVEGLVARHVRASHQDVDTAVFDTPDFGVEPDVALDSLGGFAGLEPDVTRDEMVLPRPRPLVATKALADPLSGTDSGESEPNDSDERV
jgi:hypothetical protein